MKRALLNLSLWLGPLAPLALPPVQGRPAPSDGHRQRTPAAVKGTGFITLEEHWISPAFLELYANTTGSGSILSAISDVGPDRIAHLDAGGIAIQVISHAPLAAPQAMFMSDTVAQANTELAAAVQKFPDRLRGLCMLAMGQPDAAAAELRRCVTELGFHGALVDGHITTPQGNIAFYDGPVYDVLWEVATELDVPIYLHPADPPLVEARAVGTGLYAPSAQGEFALSSAQTLSTTGWGWHETVGLGFIKMWLGGVFDRFPGLQIVIGHYGEMLPYWLWRADTTLSAGANRTLSLRETFHRNLWITTSAIFSLEPMYTLLNVTDTSRIMYSVDYPFSSNENGRAFMENEFRPSGLVSKEVFLDIARRNAQKLLKI